MTDLGYNARTYVKFTVEEFFQIIVTAFLAALILSMRDLLFERFGDVASVQRLLFIFMLMLLVLLVTVWLCKIVAVRLGYTIEYRAHYIGMMLGAFICFASAGYLPIFLPGGFDYNRPMRLALGHWRPWHKGWEVGLIAASFPLIMIAWVLVFSPVYIFTRADLYLHAMTAVILTGVYACIPAPNFIMHQAGRAIDWFRYFRGTTFGLELAYVSPGWWLALCFTVIAFWGLTFLLTVIDNRVGIGVYIFAMVLGACVFWIYRLFFKKA
jgi:hypothetical protein